MGVQSEQPKVSYRICVVGSGKRFLSGISYYTLRLSNAFAVSHQVSVILMRQLLPTFLYPGRKRVGAKLTELDYHSKVRIFDGVNWYWIPSILRAIWLLFWQRPEVIVLQWWTATVMHTYLVLALVARWFGAYVVIEFHEVLDTGEARLSAVQTYVAHIFPFIMGLASGFVVHSEYDRNTLEKHYPFAEKPIQLINHGPYDHYVSPALCERVAPESSCNLLFFGVIRPYKGLEDLITAFNAIPANEIEQYWLTIVGEPWEGWTLPIEMIRTSPYSDRITFIDRYVPDEEVGCYFKSADAVVLPYHRSSASGPLHIALSYGLPVVVTNVGGLSEAVAGYEGAVLVPPQNPEAIRRAITRIAGVRGQRFIDAHSWQDSVARYEMLFASFVSGPKQFTAHLEPESDIS